MDYHDIVALVPELMLVLAAIVLLLVDPLLPPDGRRGLSWLGVAPCVTAIIVTWWAREDAGTYFSEAIVNDRFAVYFKILLLAVAIVAMLLSEKHLHIHDRLLSDYYALVLFTTVGMMVMVAAIDLITFFVGLELMALSSYLLAGFFRYDSRSIEASLKYFLTGSFASVFLLMGMTLLYGTTGSTNYYAIGDAISSGLAPESALVMAVVLLLAGFAYKIAAAPFHNWAPDVYQGSPTPAAAFLSVGPKIAVFATIIRFLTHMLAGQSDVWGPLMIVIAIGTMLIGATMAIVQTDLKRMLAFSSIAHVGYLLLALAAEGYASISFGMPTILYYLAAYAFMNMGAFGILVYLANHADFDYSLDGITGIARNYPWAAGVMTLFMLSLAGIPPTAGFFAKFYLLAAVVDSGLAWLAVIGVLFSLVSAFYYLRVIVYMFMREPEEELDHDRDPLAWRKLLLTAELAVIAAAVIAIVATLLELFKVDLKGVSQLTSWMSGWRYGWGAIVLAAALIIGVLVGRFAIQHLKIVYADSQENLGSGRSVDLGIGLGLAVLAVVALGLFPGPVLDNAQDAVKGMFTGPQEESVQAPEPATLP